MIDPTPDATPVIIGPTWQRDEQSKWRLPERTLGWQVLAWTAEFLRQPDGDAAGGPWSYTDEQARFILHWYAVDEHGRFVYRYGMLRRVKGWGRSTQARIRSVRRCAPLSSSVLVGSPASTRMGSRWRRRIRLPGC